MVDSAIYWDDPAAARDAAIDGDTLAARIMGSEHPVHFQLEVAEATQEADVLGALAATTTSPQVLVRILENAVARADTVSSVFVRLHRLGGWPLLARGNVLDLPSGVRFALAREDEAPDDILLRLLEDPDQDVRLSLASNNCLPPSVAGVLVYDEADEVRWEAVQHSAVPRTILQRAATDPTLDLDTRVYARERLGLGDYDPEGAEA